MATEDADGRVGYRRPPKNSRFKPGHSGNPKGRPKHARNLKTEFLDELSEVIRVREGDREMKITKQRAFVKALVAAAIKGDMRAANALVSFCTRAFGDEDDDARASAAAPDDLEILDEFVGREVRKRAARGGADGDSISVSAEENDHE
jgi:hypothetical protein